ILLKYANTQVPKAGKILFQCPYGQSIIIYDLRSVKQKHHFNKEDEQYGEGLFHSSNKQLTKFCSRMGVGDISKT
ncbi:MAG: hypothetical protein QF535_23845, partial [Anaerolineales bacterium]|nr:hypothetical protein [Anaerolineales bacterium]